MAKQTGGRKADKKPAGSNKPKALPTVKKTDTSASGSATKHNGPRNSGAGGRARFWLAPAYRDANGKVRYEESKAVRFRLLPARNSYFDRQGQRIPGAGAGMQFKTLYNLAKLKIPGARPVYQQMGIDEESIEMVGEFAGFDLEHYEDTISSFPANAVRENAFEEAQHLLRLLSQGSEVAIIISTWEGRAEYGSGSEVFDLKTHYDDVYIGRAKLCELALAHEQRVYWHLVIVVTGEDPDDDNAYLTTVRGPVYEELKASMIDTAKPITPANSVNTTSWRAGITPETDTRATRQWLEYEQYHTKKDLDIKKKNYQFLTDLKKQQDAGTYAGSQPTVTAKELAEAKLSKDKAEQKLSSIDSDLEFLDGVDRKRNAKTRKVS